MDTKQIILLALRVAIFATVFGFGLQAKLDDVAYVLRRPGLLLRSLLAIFVVMPMLIVMVVKVLDPSRANTRRFGSAKCRTSPNAASSSLERRRPRVDRDRSRHRS
jgi:hypothetical protein